MTKSSNRANVNLENFKNKHHKDFSMTMAFGAEQLRKSDDPKDQEVAKLLEAALALRGKDIPLPGHETAPTTDETKTELGKTAVEHAASIDDQQLLTIETFPDTARFATTEAPMVGLSVEAPTNMGELVADIQNLPQVQAVIEAARAKAVYHPDEEEKRTKRRGGDKYIQWKMTRTVVGKRDTQYENKLIFDAETKEPKMLEVKTTPEDHFTGLHLVINYTAEGLSSLNMRFSGANSAKVTSILGLEEKEGHYGVVKSNKPFLRVSRRPVDLSMHIDLEIGNLGLTIKSWPSGQADKYTYNPDQDIFEGRREGTTTLQPESAEDFKGLIRQTLSLIPVETKAI